MRYFLAAFLPITLADPLQAIRRQHSSGSDPFTPPHITLVRSFWQRGVQPEEELLARLAAVQKQIPSFELKLGSIGAFYEPKRVIYLNVELTEGLKRNSCG